MTDALLETAGLSKSFGAVDAVVDVSLSFDRGECHGIIGPNGSGKTTLFDLLTGFQDPDSGTVRFDGEDVTALRPDQRANRGLVRTFQIVSPFEGLTARENLHSVYAGGPRSNLRVPASTKERAEEVLETLELTGVAEQEAGDLSGGQQKLLELGRTLMLDPACLLLDEPTAGVNPSTQQRVLDTLRRINDGGTTVVVIEHDMNVIGDLADQVTVLADGEVVTSGAFEAVTDDDRVREAYIGRARDSEQAAGAAAGVDAGDHVGAETTPANGGAVGSASVENVGATTSSNPSGGNVTAERGAATSIADSHGDGEMPHLVAENVVAGYGNQLVLNGASVRTHDGVTCVFGPNGSGKSTLLKAITGVVPVQSGTVQYGDRSITNWRPHDVVAAGITTVPQRERVFRGLTVRENLQLGATTVSDREAVQKRMDAVLEVFPDLEPSLSEQARSLSGGQQVMLGVARAMMTGADVYLLDEPLSGLAPSMVDEVLDVIRTLVDQGTRVVLVEQHVREALRIADHVYLLAQGDVRFDGTPAELRATDDFVDLYLGIE